MMSNSESAPANISLPWIMGAPHELPDITGVPFLGLSDNGSSKLFASTLNSYGSLMCVFGLVAFLKTYFDKLQSLFEQYFTVTLHVKATDETFDMLMAWVRSRGVDNAAKSIIARVGGKSKTDDKKLISFSPWTGSFSFRFGRKSLSFEMQTVTTGLHKEEVIAISCLGTSVQILKDFIAECRHEYLQQTGSKITMFKNSGDYWKRISTKERRPLATVITSGSLKQELVDDLKNFLSEETRHWYMQRSIPYRRGYLLHGPPGTGKSSLGSAVAGEFDLDIYIISAPSVDDQTLEELFNSLPQRCVVLLEDIDAIGTDRQDSDKGGKKKKALSLSGLLNTLDGVASQEGRVLIMTTNHIKNLDSALIRPGRIDMRFEIPLADSDVTKDLFSFVFGPEKHHNAVDEEIFLELSRLAADFAKKVPELKYSTAQIMSYLLKHKNSAEKALKEADDWFGVAPTEKQVKTGERKRKESIETPQHLEDGLWMKTGNDKYPAENRLKRTKTFPDLNLIKPVSPPSLCASTPPLSAVGESVVHRASAPSDAGAGTEPDLVVQDHGSTTDCDHDARIWDAEKSPPSEYFAHKMTEDDGCKLGAQGWREEPCDQVWTSDNEDRWLELKPQDGNGTLHLLGMLKKAIIVTTSIEQTISPSTESMAISKIQTDIKAMRPVPLGDNTSGLPSLDLGSPDLLFGSHAFDGIGDSPGEITGSAPQSALLRAPTTPRDERSARDSNKTRELTINSGRSGLQNIVPEHVAWRMPDAVDWPRGTGLAKTPKLSSCNDAEQTGWVEVVSNILSTEIEGLGREAGRPVDTSEA